LNIEDIMSKTWLRVRFLTAT